MQLQQQISTTGHLQILRNSRTCHLDVFGRSQFHGLNISQTLTANDILTQQATANFSRCFSFLTYYTAR